jgi:hypothetical protein
VPVRSRRTRSVILADEPAATSTTRTVSGCTACSGGWRGSSRPRWCRHPQPGPRRPGRPGAVAGWGTPDSALRRGVDALMSCDQCREREAVIHLTQIVNDQVTTLHLCERCAAEKGVESPASVTKTPLGTSSRRWARKPRRRRRKPPIPAPGAVGPSRTSVRAGASAVPSAGAPSRRRSGSPPAAARLDPPRGRALRRPAGRGGRAESGGGRSAGAAPRRGGERELRAGGRAA